LTQARLVADVGGTNTRLCLAMGGALRRETLRSYRNDDFAGFADVVRAYLDASGATGVSEAVVAIAGPVTNQKGRLTNRDWPFTSATLADVLPEARLHLINDLSALGYSVPKLEAAHLDPILTAPPPAADIEQALVIGVGTGFNVSCMIRAGGRTLCPEAEMGHVPLPFDVRARLVDGIGARATAFITNEHLFSGRGYQTVESAYRGEDFAGYYAELLGIFARGALLAFMPRRGIYFSGGVARNLLATKARERFIEAFRQPLPLDVDLVVPVYAILDDSAALMGCADYAF
jgi:glucokinase